MEVLSYPLSFFQSSQREEKVKTSLKPENLVRAFIFYPPPLKTNSCARELFCRHAFPQSKPSEELDDLIEGFLKICGGLPLSLKVLGGLLSSQCDKDYWEQAVGCALQPSWHLDDWDPLDPPPNTLTGPPPHDYTIPSSSSKVGQPESSRQRPLGSKFGRFGPLRSFYRFLEN
jgi:hypothetical protein